MWTEFIAYLSMSLFLEWDNYIWIVERNKSNSWLLSEGGKSLWRQLGLWCDATERVICQSNQSYKIKIISSALQTEYFILPGMKRGSSNNIGKSVDSKDCLVLLHWDSVNSHHSEQIKYLWRHNKVAVLLPLKSLLVLRLKATNLIQDIQLTCLSCWKIP